MFSEEVSFFALVSKLCSQEKLTTEHNGRRWIVDSYFLGPPDGAIPEDDTTPPTAYYNRDVPIPTWNEVYESSQIVVYCKSFVDIK